MDLSVRQADLNFLAKFARLLENLRYQPFPRLNLTGKFVFTSVGRDSIAADNWGGDILKGNVTREKEFGNTILQGTDNDILFGSFTASWHLKHNIFIDASVILRQSKSPVQQYNNNTLVTSFALRWNIAQRFYEF